MPWLVRMAEEFEADFSMLDEAVQDEILAGVSLLADYGPHLGRPYVDTLKGAKHRNLKEFRFEAVNGVWRLAFAFDPLQTGILLVAGDKSGVNEARFYRRLIAKADKRYAALEAVGQRGEEEGSIAMGRTINEIIASLPKERQQRIEAEHQRLKNEVETLRELREAAGKAQAHIAATLNIKQPSVSKIERQTDMYLSTLRSYVEALGGELELTVRFPSRPPVRLGRLGDVLDSSAGARPTRAVRSQRRKAPTPSRRQAKKRRAAVPA
jgi:transcriptional regulator with XRE-family HTH domain